MRAITSLRSRSSTVFGAQRGLEAAGVAQFAKMLTEGIIRIVARFCDTWQSPPRTVGFAQDSPSGCQLMSVKVSDLGRNLGNFSWPRLRANLDMSV